MNKFLPISISFLFFIFIMSKSWGLPLCPKKTKFSLNRDLCYGYFHYQNGYKYNGEWKNNKLHGQGTLKLPNGNKYIGEFKDGLPNGYGT